MLRSYLVRCMLSVSVLLPSFAFASPLLGNRALLSSGSSPTEYTGPTAGQIQNVSNGTQTVNSIVMVFSTGNVVNGSCVGTEYATSTASTGSLSFQSGDYLHLSPVAVYNALSQAIIGADPADMTCVRLTMLDTETSSSSLNFFNPYSSDGTTLYPVGTSANFNIVCDPLSTSCTTSDPTLPVAVMQNRIAVGSYVDGLVTLPLSYNSADDGNHWAISTTLPAPAANIDGSINSLLASACGVNGLQCVAVGNFSYPGSPGTGPLTTYSTDGGINWTAPAGAPPTLDTNNSLNGVACDSSGLICNAVGYMHDDSGTNLYIPLSYYTTDGGDSWTQSNDIPVPQNGGTPTGNAYLYGIACAQTGQKCAAVGNYVDANNQTVPLSYTSTDGGQNWALSSTLPPAQTTTNKLSSVACDSAGEICTAVGYYYNAGLNVPLAYTSTDFGNSWVLSTTLPAANGHNDILTSVSCGADGLYCSAVGYDDNHHVLSYYSTDSGATWTAASISQPIGSNPQLMNVFCLGAGPQCSATGFYTSGGVVIPLSYWSDSGGRNWTLSATQPAAIGAGDNKLYSSI